MLSFTYILWKIKDCLDDKTKNFGSNEIVRGNQMCAFSWKQQETYWPPFRQLETQMMQNKKTL